YLAPVRPAAAPGSDQPAQRTPGRPVPGQPIFQRPRPQAPGARPQAGGPAAGRRPMHPTSPRTGMSAGARPGFAPRPGMGGPPPAPGRTTRPGGPSRRPGQRYVPRGVKEGPMKGFVPPPRLSLSNEPQPITREITITEGISVKDLAEKLGIRAKDLIMRLLARGVFATVNQTLDAELAREMARHFGAESKVITFEEQLIQDSGPSVESAEA